MGGYIKSLIGAKAASIGLQVASIALNTAITMGVSLAISALVSQISKWIHAQEEARQKSVELTNSYKEQQSSLDSQIERYKELKETLDKGNLSTDESRSIKEQLLEIQQSLIESYGDEASNIDLVNGKYREQLVLLSELSKEKATDYVTENRDVFADAKEALEKIRTYNLGTVTSWNTYAPETEDQKRLIEYLETYSDLLDLTYSGASGRGVTATSVSLSVKADVENADEIMHQLAEDLEKYGKDNNIDVSGLLEGISGQLKKTWTDELTEYKTVYDEFMKAEIVRNDTLRPLYQESIKAVEDYNNALSTGEGVEEAKANLDSVQQSVQNATGELKGSQDVFDGIYDGINKDAEAAYNLGQAFANDKTVQEYAEQLRGLSDIDLKAINFDNDNTEKGEEAFRGLMETLGLTEEQVQSLIDKLVELGYVQGERVKNQKESYTSFSNIFSLKDAENTLTTLGKISESIDTIQNAYKTLNDAINEYNENGSFSVDTLQSVIALGDDWLDYLVDEEGNLKLDKEALEVLTKSRLEDMRVQTINNLIDNVSNINDDISAKKYLESTNYAVAKSYEELTEKTLAFKRADLIDSGVSESMADAVIEKAQSDIEKINKLFDNVDMSVESLTGGKGKSSSKSSSETIDWIETLLSRIQRTITNLGKTVSATYKNWSKRNNALAQEMGEINKEISAQVTAYNTYMAKANSISLPDEYKSLVRNGGFSFSEIKDEALKKNIDLYRQWYEKALNCSDVIEDLRSNLADLAKTKFDNVSKQYDNQMLMIDHNIQMLQGFVEQSESAGYMASEVYYQAMAEKQQESIAQLQDKYGSLLSAFDEAVKNGSIEKYSEEWYDMLGNINDVEEALQSANTQLIKFNQTLQQLGWSVFDRIRDSVDGISTEANFLIDLISRSDLFTEAGQMTNEGLAVQGLHAVNYNTYMEQSLAYAKEIEKINDEIAKDPYDLELINRKNELIKAQQEAIQNANAEKDAIQSLIKDGYDNMLSYLDKLIQKQKDFISDQKNLFDYQNSIADQTSNIANLRKQLQAYSGDNSESSKAIVQKLNVSLTKAEKDLRQSEYDKYLDDQQALLDSFYNETEQWINQRLDDIDSLIIKAVDATNKNAETISNTINKVANGYNFKLSDELNTIWNNSNNSIDNIGVVVGVYGDIIHDDIVSADSNITSAINGGNTNVISAINGIQGNMNQMISALNTIAANNKNTISSGQNTAINSQPNSTPNTGNVGSTGNIGSSQPNSKPSNSNNNAKIQSLQREIDDLQAKYDDAYKKYLKHKNEYERLTKSGNVPGYAIEPVKKSMNDNLALTYKYLEQIKAKQDALKSLRGYASGSKRINKNEIAWTQENGTEFIYRASDGAILTPLGTGDKVFTKEMSDNLWNIANRTVSLPKLPSIQRSTSSVNNDIQLNVAVKADNFEEFVSSFKVALKNDAQCRKLVQAITVDELVGKGGLSRNKF